MHQHWHSRMVTKRSSTAGSLSKVDNNGLVSTAGLQGGGKRPRKKNRGVDYKLPMGNFDTNTGMTTSQKSQLDHTATTRSIIDDKYSKRRHHVSCTLSSLGNPKETGRKKFKSDRKKNHRPSCKVLVR